MSKVGQGIVVAIVLALPVRAWAFGFRSHTTVTYYLPTPIVYVPVATYQPYPVCLPPPVYAVAPPHAIPSNSYARPTAAPPSAGPSTPEPPLAAPPTPAKPSAAPANRALGFGESASFYDVYPVAGHPAAAAGGERHTIDFWNLTDRDLTLRIDGGPSQRLPRGKSLPVATGSQFTWQVEGRPAQPAHFDSGDSGLEIVIRR
jgi:hypothetical protein